LAKNSSKGFDVKKLTLFLITILFVGTSIAGIKYVAVVETGIDERSGAAAEITGAEVALVTAELRREAVNNLPSDRFSVMTSETVQSMGGAVLEECSEENCVITLGSKIGADYIVRGTISKLRALFTLSVEIYETDNGTLLALSDPVRSESIDELVDKAAVACANMYRKFAESQNITQKPTAAVVDTVVKQAQENTKPKKEKPAPKPIEWPPMKLSAGGGAFFANDFGGGLNWSDGVQVTMPYIGGGAYLFFDATYAVASATFSGGGGKWESGNVAATDTTILPEMSRMLFNIGVLAKYPFTVGSIKLFPLLGIDYETALSAELNTNGYKYPFDASDLNALWFKFGGGIDAALGEKMYIRAELLYGLRGTNKFEDREKGKDKHGAEIESAGGVTVRVGVGINL
jgi:hypothetical protein